MRLFQELIKSPQTLCTMSCSWSRWSDTMHMLRSQDGPDGQTLYAHAQDVPDGQTLCTCSCSRWSDTIHMLMFQMVRHYAHAHVPDGQTLCTCSWSRWSDTMHMHAQDVPDGDQKQVMIANRSKYNNIVVLHSCI